MSEQLRRNQPTGFNQVEIDLLVRATKVTLADARVVAWMTPTEQRLLGSIQERLLNDAIRLHNEAVITDGPYGREIVGREV